MAVMLGSQSVVMMVALMDYMMVNSTAVKRDLLSVGGLDMQLVDLMECLMVVSMGTLKYIEIQKHNKG